MSCHQIHHPSQQATYQHTNGCNGEDALGCHNTVQHYTLSIQHLKLSANYTPHLIHLGKLLVFSTSHESSYHTNHGLY